MTSLCKRSKFRKYKYISDKDINIIRKKKHTKHTWIERESIIVTTNGRHD